MGVRDSVLSDRSSVPSRADAVRNVIAELAGPGVGPAPAWTAPPVPDLIVAAGMPTSEVGLLALPHVLAPVGLPDLADAVATHSDTSTDLAPADLC